MDVFRIARAAHISDMSGRGAELYGGRWNHRGVPVLYTSESRSLATVEYLVHVPPAYAPSDLRIATVRIPDDLEPEETRAADLPRNWRRFPPPSQLADLGTSWARACGSLLLRVPSAAIDREYNVLINPLHRDMSRVRVVEIEAHTFDERLLR